MSKCPYDDLPESGWWRPSLVETPPHAVEPIHDAPFSISRNDRISTAGSCFAQEMSRYIDRSGFKYLVTEPGPLRLSDAERRARQYGLFTARFGNIYTSRQLLQLVKRAYGLFEPAEDYWKTATNRFVDPLRPSVEPEGFSSAEELLWDREQHLEAVRTMVETTDILVFTLGLTECWRSRTDGTVYPVCPGCGFGTNDPSLHEFHNLSVAEVVADLTETFAMLRAKNERLRLVLTLSPVPLIATMSDRHVLTATTYSKAVLRVAAEEFVRNHESTCYFPSYEIVLGSHTRGQYFGDNLRSVTRHGVDHVMRCFFKMFSEEAVAPDAKHIMEAAAPQAGYEEHTDAERAQSEALVADVICDEDTLQQRYEANKRL